jgi:hypothetical protein
VEEEMALKNGTTTQEISPKIKLRDTNVEVNHGGLFYSTKGRQ